MGFVDTEKWLEGALVVFRRDADTGIADLKDWMPVFCLDPGIHAAAGHGGSNDRVSAVQAEANALKAIEADLYVLRTRSSAANGASE